jgi:hypothetical protein
MQADLILERIERRLSVDPVTDAEWLRTEAKTVMEHGLRTLRIINSMRYSDEDVRQFGAAQVRAWIDDDHRCYDAFQRGEWWFLDACAVATIAVFVGREKVGSFEVMSSCLGGIESDAPRSHLDEITDEMVGELREQLRGWGFAEVDAVEADYVVEDDCIAVPV